MVRWVVSGLVVVTVAVNIAQRVVVAQDGAAVANGGHLIRPHLVRSEEGAPRAGDRLPLAAEHLDLVREALRDVVNEPGGTGHAAALAGVDVAGKTGTAQVIAQERRVDNEELAPENRDHAWFASFAPAQDPRLVVVVFVENGGAGSRAAAPLARALYEQFFEADRVRRAAAEDRV